MMNPPDLDRSSLKALDRTLALMIAFLRTLIWIERTIGLPRWVFKLLKRLDAEADAIEHDLFEGALRAELDAKMRALFGTVGRAECNDARQPHAAESTPGVTTEAPLGASGRPSPNDAASAERENAHPNAPQCDASNTHEPQFETPLAIPADLGADSNQFPASTPGVTAETPLHASGRPSRNHAARAKRSFARARASGKPARDTHASLKDQIPIPKITPSARPPPARRILIGLKIAASAVARVHPNP